MQTTFAFALLCVSFGLLDALPFFDTLTAPKRAPQPCCYPDQLEYSLGESAPFVAGGKPGLAMISGRVAVDYKAKKMTINELMVVDGKTTNQTTYANLASRESYVVDWNQKKCSKGIIPSIYVNQCLPKDARYGGSLTYGLGQTLSADQWTMHLEDKESKMDVEVYVTMTSDCVPVTQSVVGRVADVDVAAGLSFFNIKNKISDPSVFDVPAICKQQDVETLPVTTTFRNQMPHKL